LIFFEQYSGTAVRRFQQFKELYNRLLEEKIENVPRLPSEYLTKQLMPFTSVFDQDFLTARAEELQEFLEKCSKNPLIKLSMNFRQFLENEQF